MTERRITEFFAVKKKKKKSVIPKVVRIRRKKGKLVQDCDIYIGRECFRGGWNLSRSKWYNPFSVNSCGSNERACEKYEEYIRKKPELMHDLDELTGKILGCWCKPKKCHGDVLVKLFKEEVIGKKRKIQSVDNSQKCFFKLIQKC